MTDDIYPRDGETYDTTYYPDPPAEQVEEEQIAKGIQAASYPVMGAIADWFDEQIKGCDSLEHIAIDKMTINGVTYERTVSIEGQLLAHKLLKNLLLEKYAEFESFKNES